MDVSVDTTVNTDSITLVIIGLMVAAAFFVLINKAVKNG
jgi:hypothetical protein